MDKKIIGVFGGIVGMILSFFNSLPYVNKTLITLMILDFILGVVKAYKKGNLDSNVMWSGGLRKTISFVVIFVAYQLANITGLEMLKEMSVMYYIAMETLSIFEHATDMGVPLPNFLKKLAERLKNENDDVEVG